MTPGPRSPAPRAVAVTDSLAFGGGRPPVFIAGPCVIENEEHCLRMARGVAAAGGDADVPVIFKASFDKANRTSIRSYRGPGLQEGLKVLSRVKQETGLPVLSDVHDPAQAEAAGEVLDVLQIPAFLCRQTDLLLAAGRTGRVVNIKKGQFVAPGDMARAVEKVASTGNDRVVLTERGATFGYHNLVVDMRSLAIMRDLGCPVIFDATHSVQLPGADGETSGGEPRYIEILARAAAAAGIDGLFTETHDDPAAALSDGANALPLPRLVALMRVVTALDRLIADGGKVDA